MKKILLLSLALVGTVLLCSCESKEIKEAKALLQQADDLRVQEQYDEALILLDSLQDTYPTAVDQRREALAMTRDLRLITDRRDSAEIAPRMEQMIEDLERREKSFSKVTVPDMPDETLMRYKGYDPSQASGQPFLDAYIQSDGQIEMVGGYTAGKTRDIVGLRVSAPDGSYVVSDTIAYDGGRNYRFEDSGHVHHRLTLSLDAAKRIGVFVAHSSSARTLKVVFLDAKGAEVGSFALTADARHAIVETYAFFATYVEIKNMEERLSKFEARKELYCKK